MDRAIFRFARNAPPTTLLVSFGISYFLQAILPVASTPTSASPVEAEDGADGLSRLSLCPRRDSNPHCGAFKAPASAVGLRGPHPGATRLGRRSVDGVILESCRSPGSNPGRPQGGIAGLPGLAGIGTNGLPATREERVASLEELDGRVTAIEARLDMEATVRAALDVDVSNLGVKLGSANRLLAALSVTQSEHTRTLARHTAVLDQLSATIGAHSETLDSHTRTLDQHTENSIRTPARSTSTPRNSIRTPARSTSTPAHWTSRPRNSTRSSASCATGRAGDGGRLRSAGAAGANHGPDAGRGRRREAGRRGRRSRHRRSTSSSIASLSRPVKVFCWLTW